MCVLFFPLPLQTVSGDGNAEKLCACYEPHVCLTRDALVRLLDNHGPEFVEQWELPVWVKLNQGKGTAHITWKLIRASLSFTSSN